MILPGEKHKGKALGMMDSLYGFGFMTGPLIGGVLYKYGGFYLPFMVLGSTTFMCSIIALMIIKIKLKTGPDHNEATEASRTKFSTLLKIPQGGNFLAFSSPHN